MLSRAECQLVHATLTAGGKTCVYVRESVHLCVPDACVCVHMCVCVRGHYNSQGRVRCPRASFLLYSFLSHSRNENSESPPTDLKAGPGAWPPRQTRSLEALTPQPAPPVPPAQAVEASMCRTEVGGGERSQTSRWSVAGFERSVQTTRLPTSLSLNPRAPFKSKKRKPLTAWKPANAVMIPLFLE